MKFSELNKEQQEMYIKEFEEKCLLKELKEDSNNITKPTEEEYQKFFDDLHIGFRLNKENKAVPLYEEYEENVVFGPVMKISCDDNKVKLNVEYESKDLDNSIEM